jgi:FkbM family methyltransferase
MKYRIIRNSLRKFGIDMLPYPNGSLRCKLELLKLNNIDLILDAGASDGGFANQIRSIGYKGKIISFEPVSISYKRLTNNAKYDKNWTTLNIALGDSDGDIEINIAGNLDSSSILSMNDSHLAANPKSKYQAKEIVNVRRLDSIFSDCIINEDKILLKLDVQGYEKQVLDGAVKSLKQIKGIQIEMSFEELYKGSSTFDEMKHWIESEGFTLCLLESGNRNKVTGKLLQVDGTFYRISN